MRWLVPSCVSLLTLYLQAAAQATPSVAAAAAAPALPAASPAPIATPGTLTRCLHVRCGAIGGLIAPPTGRAGVRQLTAEEFYIRAAVRFLPVDGPAPPRFSTMSTSGADSFAAPPELVDTLLVAAVTMNVAETYDEAATELAGPVLGTTIT